GDDSACRSRPAFHAICPPPRFRPGSRRRSASVEKIPLTPPLAPRTEPSGSDRPTRPESEGKRDRPQSDGPCSPPKAKNNNVFRSGSVDRPPLKEYRPEEQARPHAPDHPLRTAADATAARLP